MVERLPWLKTVWRLEDYGRVQDFSGKLDQNNPKMMTLVWKWSPTDGKFENYKNWNDITNYAKIEIAIIFLFAKFAKSVDLC